MNDDKKFELKDNDLENVVGGHSVGDTIRCRRKMVNYCSKCGRLLMNFEATITEEDCILNGKKYYWVSLSCCGARDNVCESSIIE